MLPRPRILRLLVLALALAACRQPHKAPPSRPLDVAFAGCESVLRGPTCELRPSREIDLFVATEDPVAVSASGQQIASIASHPVGGGVRYRVRIPEGSSRVRVECPQASAEFELAVDSSSSPEVVQRAKGQRGQGDAEGAIRLLSDAQARCAGPDCARIASELGRAELARGRVAEAVEMLQASALQHQAEGHVSEWVQDTRAAVYALTERLHQFSRARQLLASLDGAEQVFPAARAMLPTSRGALAMWTGNFREALRFLQQAIEHGLKLGLDQVTRSATYQQADVLHRLGRYREAIALLETALEQQEGRSTCDRGDIALNLAWYEMLSKERPARSPTVLLEQALAHYQKGCPNPHKIANAHVNLALAGVLDDDLEATLRHLAASRAAAKPPSVIVALWQLEVEGRLRLGRKQPTLALAAFDEAFGRASSVGALAMQWRATVGRAEALEALGRQKQALAAYEQAEQLLDREVLWAPLGEGRSGFLGDRQRSARGRVELLVRGHRWSEAFKAARVARVRLLGELESLAEPTFDSAAQREQWERALSAYHERAARLEATAKEDWGLPANEVAARSEQREQEQRALRTALDDAFAVLAKRASSRPPSEQVRASADGELMLLAFAVPKGWLGFAATSDQVRVQRLPDSKDVMARLLRAFEGPITQARRISILPSGQFEGVPVHTLPVGDKPLCGHAPVAYLVDVPGAGAPQPATPQHAAIVADTVGNLPASRKEAELVHEHLVKMGIPVQAYFGKAASRQAMADIVRKVDLLHFAGHGRAAGYDGWEGALSLAEGARWTVGEIVTLKTVPRFVVLSGCETSGTTGALGLAQAFVVAGAQQVVATSVEVDDRMAHELVGEMYQEAAAAPLDLVAALSRAQATLLQRDPKGAWASFRALSR